MTWSAPSPLPLALALLALLLAPTAAEAQGDTDALGARQRYEGCMTLARNDPGRALEQATAWRQAGGRGPAEHCAAVALVGLGEFAEAARRLETLAGEIDESMRADLLAQAGQAWLMNDEPDKAYAMQSRALALEDDDAELWIDRGITLASQAKYWEAIDDFNRAHDLAPRRADVLVYRATAYRYAEVPELAMDDVKRALEIDPNNPEGLLERGVLKRIAGDPEGARADWQAVLRAAPNTPAAAFARRNLETLDAGGG